MKLLILCAIGCGLAISDTASACSIPVFRYAMTRWAPDPYDLIVFHRGDLTPQQRRKIDRLQQTTPLNVPLANCIVRTVDLSRHLTPDTQEFWRQQNTDTLPWVVAKYPRYAPVQGALWSGPLTAIDELIDSPARRTIAGRLLDDEAAVWVLLESGSATKDDVAATLLRGELDQLNRTLKASTAPPEPGETQTEAAPDESTVRFSMIRLPRDSKSEHVLVEMLLSCEPDLRDYDEPMAIPVFGRGRALYALVGKGITADNIMEACVFLVEGCSCQVKAQNPGADLLMTVDWEGEMLDEPGASTQPALVSTDIEQTTPASPKPGESDMLGRRAILRNSLFVFAAALVVAVVAGLTLYRRSTDAIR